MSVIPEYFDSANSPVVAANIFVREDPDEDEEDEEDNLDDEDEEEDDEEEDGEGYSE
jgi:hypothetical protein